MEKFSFSPDDCLILKAFRDSKTLRGAAGLLGCDPAGLARRVQYISSQHGVLHKVNGRWQLTARGLDLVVWAENSMQSQKNILYARSSLRLASTMWFSEEILIPHLPFLRKILGENAGLSLSVPDKGFELSLIDGSADFVVVCHPPENPEIEHKRISEEKWILIAPPSWQRQFKGDANTFLKDRPFIRHRDLNHDLFLPDFSKLKESGIIIDNLIGIRTAVQQGLGWSLVPKILVHHALNDNRLCQIPHEISLRDRHVCLWWLRNRIETKRQAGKIAAWVKESCQSA